MTSERYQRVKEVFLAVCDHPDAEQDEAAAKLCGDDAELKAEVDSLLQSHRHADRSSVTSWINPESQQAGNATEPDPPALSEELEPPLPKVGSKTPGKTPGKKTPPRPQPVHRSVEPSHRSHISQPSGTNRNDTPSGTNKGRFATGTVLAERYRIVSILGIGGMGEVYRADDIVLDQPVALKFLPPSFEENPDWLERFHNEVRLARQVTHPNVCRVFDIGQVDNEQFISMEFVDGEDLSSLLRRIGRLPQDKAVQIARQLCAGLAAAHDKGVLHRDLKPANVMLDGRGQVRITDFGISGRVDGAHDAAAGTPAYMAPEQFTKGEATVRSDIYSLGLLLYEIFTGRQAFSAHSLPEYARLHRQSSPTHPSTFIADMDPLVERVILRCLEKDPSKRPGSALAVAAALPGGDPLAAALAAGETPTPEMVAAAGNTTGISPLRAVILLGIILAGLIGLVLMSARAMVIPRIHDGIKPPAALAEHAQEILAAAGYGDSAPKSRAQGFGLDEQYIAWIHDADWTRSRWDKLGAARPGLIYFWYRQSPQYMISKDDIGMVTMEEPARSVPGMRTIVLDVTGRLKRLEVLPDASWKTAANTASQQADFSPLFTMAGLKQEQMTSVAPVEIPPMYVGARYAWTGTYPENPDVKIRVEAASLNSRPVFFDIREYWQDEADPKGIVANPDLPTGRNIVLQATLIIVATASSLLLAWRNLLAGRGDSAGAQKLSGAFLVLGLLIWLLCANHVPELFLEMRSFFRVLGFILVPAIIVWMFYLALEPYVRKTWPETVISWSRALSGRLTDPLVASHVLAGLAVGVAATILGELTNVIPMHYNRAAAVPNITMLVRFLGKENPTSVALWSLMNALYMGLLYLLSMVLFLIVLRRKSLAMTALVLLGAANTVQWYNPSWVQWIQSGLVTILTLYLLVRYGLVATVAGLWCTYLLRYIPITPDMSVWYAAQTRFAVALITLIAVAAAMLATGKWRALKIKNVKA